MKKYILLFATLVAVLATVCLSFASCDIEDLLDPITSDTGTATDTETENETETEIHDEAPWFPPETDGTTDAESHPESGSEDSNGGAVPIDPVEWETGEAHIFNLADSYVQDEYLFLRAEHLSVSGPNVTYPAILRISDLTAWRNFYAGQSSGGGTAVGLFDEEFFSTHSLLVLITEGRSGSIRYRVDGVTTTEGALNVELTAVVPDAITMDIVHWCVVIPVEKENAELPVEVIARDERESGEDGSDSTFLPRATDIRDLRFDSHDGSAYIAGDALIGRVMQGFTGDTPDDEINGWMQGFSFPAYLTVESLAAWQTFYGGTFGGNAYANASFEAGMAALDQAFFAEKSLLVLFVEEGSGSNRHRVDGVVAKDGILTVTLTTLYPEVGTCDMAYWAILIPVDKEIAELPVQVEMATERME